MYAHAHRRIQNNQIQYTKTYSHILTRTLTRTHSYAHTHSHCTHAYSIALIAHSHSLTLTHPHTHLYSLTLTHTHRTRAGASELSRGYYLEQIKRWLQVIDRRSVDPSSCKRVYVHIPTSPLPLSLCLAHPYLD